MGIHSLKVMGHVRITGAFLLLSLYGATAASIPARQAPDRIVVKLRPMAEEPGLHARAPLSGAAWRIRLGLPEGVSLRGMHRPRSRTLGPLRSLPGMNSALDVDRPVIVDLRGHWTVQEALEQLAREDSVEYAEPDFVGSGGGVPSDPNYRSQWHHTRIQSPAAWDISTGSSDILVAVLDTGINTTLPEFRGRLVPGYDYVNDDDDPTDDHGHGTAVAGTLAANANNGVLVAGMDWSCRLLPGKILDSDNNGFYSWWAEAIYDATDAGAKVINFSSGGDSDSSSLREAIRYAIGKGVIFVTISHNDGKGTVRFPGRMPECITVGGTERTDLWASFSNYGPSVDLVAPARDIYTVGRSGGLEFWWGTSFAAPQVSGVAALLASLDPTLVQGDVERLLCASAQDRVGGSRDTVGRDNYFGYGRLNALYALQLARARLTSRWSSPDAVSLDWSGLPANAAEKRPLQLEFSGDLVNWTPVDVRSRVVYTGTDASWLDDGLVAGTAPGSVGTKYYRSGIVR